MGSLRYRIYLQMFNSFCHEALRKLIKHLMCVPELDFLWRILVLRIFILNVENICYKFSN